MSMFSLALLLWLTPAHADEGEPEQATPAPDLVIEAVEEPAPPVEPIIISIDVDLPSALDRMDQAAAEQALRSDPGLTTWLDPQDDHSLVRGRFGVRPRLGWTGWMGQPGGAMRAGAVLRHRWWSLLPLGPQWTGESALAGSLTFAGARGPEASLHSLAGAWVGPVSLMVGPRVAWQSTSFNKGTALSGGLSAGPLALAAASLGPVSLQLGGGPGWLLAGERGSAGLVVGDEWLGLAGLGLQLGVVEWGLRGQVLSSEAGTLLDLTLGINLSLK